MTSNSNRPTANVPSHPMQVAMLIDASGSMGGLWHPTIKAANAYVDAVKGNVGLVEFTLATFKSHMTTVFDAVPMADVRAITENDYRPGGGNEIKKSLIALAEKIERRVGPDTRVIFVLQTDGGEGDGLPGYWEPAKAVVERLSARGWTFLLAYAGDYSLPILYGTPDYHGVPNKGHSAKTLAKWLGIPQSNVIGYDTTADASMAAFARAAEITANRMLEKA